MYYKKFKLDLASVEKGCSSEAHSTAYRAFQRDVFRSTLNVYSDWDAVRLKFDFTGTPKTLSLIATSGSSVTISIRTVSSSHNAESDEKKALILTQEKIDRLMSLAQCKDGYLELTIRQLKEGKVDKALSEIIGGAHDHPIYQQLSSVFMSELLSQMDQEKLVYYAHQAGLPWYLSLFALGSYLYAATSENMHLIRPAGKHEIFLKFSVELRALEEGKNSSDKETTTYPEVGRLILTARYDTVRGCLQADPVVTFNFSRTLSVERMKFHTCRLLANYAANRKKLRRVGRDPGPAKDKYYYRRPVNLMLVGLLLSLGLVCAFLTGFGLLPAMPFLAASVLGATVSSALLVVAIALIGAFVVGLGFFVLEKFNQQPSSLRVASVTHKNSFSPASKGRVVGHRTWLSSSPHPIPYSLRAVKRKKRIASCIETAGPSFSSREHSYFIKV